jgi:DHA3 family macrolide efflux protein-like MFS transporter
MRSNLRTFYVLTISQIISLIGSRMSGLALGIWVFNETGNATPPLLTIFFAHLPLMFGGTFAGVLADRWNRRRMMLVGDAGQAVGTLLLLVSFLSGHFELWHLYTIVFFQGVLGVFQLPAMEASVTMLVPEEHRDRANTLRQLNWAISGLIAPALTGAIYTLIDVTGIMGIDLATFIIAAGVLAVIHIPQPRQTDEGRAIQGSIWQEMVGGMRFLWERRVLFNLMIYSAVLNFLLHGPVSLTTPYILTLTGSETTLGIILTVVNIGVLAGGIVMMIWGGTRPRIHGIMIGLMFRALCLMIYGIVRTPLSLGVVSFFLLIANPLIDASFLSVIQAKTPPDMQGRVFSLLIQLMYIAQPLSILLTGPFVDRILEPAIESPGWAAVAPLVGSQPGSGMGLLLVVAGVAMLIMTAVVYALPRTRSLENDLPDYVALAEAQPAPVS